MQLFSTGEASVAEHNAMAAAYISVIANGLSDFDNHSLPFEQYEALAWNGLINTEAYTNLSYSERTILYDNYQSAINAPSSTCN